MKSVVLFKKFISFKKIFCKNYVCMFEHQLFFIAG